MISYQHAFDLAFNHEAPEVQIARGDTLFDDEAVLKSPIFRATDAQWTQFACMMITAKPDAVSASNALGMFEMLPRRLHDLGMVRDLRRVRGPSGRMIWTANFISPMTSKKFLKSPSAQYEAFSCSMNEYFNQLERGAIERDSKLSLSGILAVLHKCGPQGIKSWAAGKKFQATEKLVSSVEGVF